MSKDINKPSYSPKYVSEFSMGEHDFNRYNDWLKFVERWNAEVNSSISPTLEMIQHLFSGLVNLYDSWRPIISSITIKEELDAKIKEVKLKKRIWENATKNKQPINPVIVNNLVDTLGEIKTKIYDMKQKIGLGIVVRRNLTSKEKIKSGFHKGKTFDNLPEV